MPGHSTPLPLASYDSRRALASDVESSEGLHQGDLLAGLRFAPAVPVAAPLQGFEPVPLLLPLLLLQALLLSALLVGDLEEKTPVSRLREEVRADRQRAQLPLNTTGQRKPTDQTQQDAVSITAQIST